MALTLWHKNWLFLKGTITYDPSPPYYSYSCPRTTGLLTLTNIRSHDNNIIMAFASYHNRNNSKQFPNFLHGNFYSAGIKTTCSLLLCCIDTTITSYLFIFKSPLMKPKVSSSKHRNPFLQNKKSLVQAGGRQVSNETMLAQAESLMPELGESLRRIEREVLNQVQIFRQMSNMRQPQKCLLHREPFTLFCSEENRPLCVNCMYQSSAHRYHKVVPVLKALDKMERNLHSYTSKAQRAIKKIENIISVTSQNLENADVIFPVVFDELQSVYFHLQNCLVQSKNQNRAYLEAEWKRTRVLNERIRQEMIAVERELKEAMKCLEKKQGEDSMLLRYNVASSLAGLQDIFSKNLLPASNHSYLEKVNSFSQLESTLKNIFSLGSKEATNAPILPSARSYHHDPNSEFTLQTQNRKQERESQVVGRGERRKNRHSVERLRILEEVRESQKGVVRWSPSQGDTERRKSKISVGRRIHTARGYLDGNS